MADGNNSLAKHLWYRLAGHLWYRTEVIRTTWKFRLAGTFAIALALALTRGLWIPALAYALVCNEDLRTTDAILVEDFDRNYLLFERAAALREHRNDARVLIATTASPDPEAINDVPRGFVEVMSRVARLQSFEIIQAHEVEPVSLNVAYQVRHFLTKERIRSVTVVTAGFRSRRSALIYEQVLGQASIEVACVPVFGRQTPENWNQTWHGILEVTEQILKLQYYRLYVLPLARQRFQPVE